MIGETIGNFRVVKRLGSGGMGEVYLAEHKDLQTPVAVKLLNKDISDNKDHVQRFFNEARVVSKIKSAGTVKIFDSGFHNEQAYLIMELLEGEPLSKRISSRGAMPIGDVIDHARQIASVLDATHRQGVIHRDLKPDNIYIVHDDERASGERVKILDFGIAKLTGTLAVSGPKTSGTMGTPQYMAPEQWGDSSKVDWRADAYSLGCVMFEMWCGRPPFEPATIAEAFVLTATTPPPRPGELRPGIPEAVEEVILRLLAKDPADRAASMGQIVRELAELAGEPMGRSTPSPMPRLSPTPADIARPLAGPDAVATTPSIPSAAPITQPVRRAASHPAMPAVTVSAPEPPASPHAAPPMTATTLGGSAAQLTGFGGAPKKRSGGLLVGIALAVVAMVAVVVVVAVGKDKKASPSAAGAPSTATPTEPAVTPTPPPPTPTPAPPTPAPVEPTPPATATTTPSTATPPATTPPATTEPAVTTTTTTPAESNVADTAKERRQKRREAKQQQKQAATATTGTAATKTTTTTATTGTAATKTTTTTTTTPPPTTTEPAGAGSGSATTGRKRFGGNRL